jgi:glycosyltransferase involved in cell wall biosynthesis
MALEIASVMSPVGVNKKIIEDGENGYLVETEGEWFAVLEKLLTEDELRTKIGKAGKLTIEREYSVKANTPNYLKIINEII